MKELVSKVFIGLFIVIFIDDILMYFRYAEILKDHLRLVLGILNVTTWQNISKDEIWIILLDLKLGLLGHFGKAHELYFIGIGGGFSLSTSYIFYFKA